MRQEKSGESPATDPVCQIGRISVHDSTSGPVGEMMPMENERGS